MKELFTTFQKIENILVNCQLLIFNCESSSWANISTGVPQGSILGLCIFLFYIKVLISSLQRNRKLWLLISYTANTLKSNSKR